MHAYKHADIYPLIRGSNKKVTKVIFLLPPGIKGLKGITGLQ